MKTARLINQFKNNGLLKIKGIRFFNCKCNSASSSFKYLHFCYLKCFCYHVKSLCTPYYIFVSAIRYNKSRSLPERYNKDIIKLYRKQRYNKSRSLPEKSDKAYTELEFSSSFVMYFLNFRDDKK